MLIQVFNTGSSSIKFALFQHQPKSKLISGILEKIGEVPSVLKFQTSLSLAKRIDFPEGCADHKTGIRHILEFLEDEGKAWGSPEMIVHRVIHGANAFRQATSLNQEVMKVIREMIPMARLHHPASLTCIKEITRRFPEIPQTVVFDTSFHQTLPEYAWRYALPREVCKEHGIRRYGFHGISHQSALKQASEFLGKPISKLNMITLHLGNGASISAIEQGRCVDTTMGMTPLEGLVMGTRPGDLDPGISSLLQGKGWSAEQYEQMLNQDSGMKGLCGSNDFREILLKMEKGNSEALLALNLYCYRIRKTIGAYCAVVGPVDALVFTGGVGENSSWVREHSLKGLEWMGLQLDPDLNHNSEASCAINSKDSSIDILVLPCQEEWEMASQAAEMFYKNNP